MSQYNYKTKDGTESGFIPDKGVIVDGKITSKTPIENPNLELIDSVEDAPVTATASQQNEALPETAGDADTTVAEEQANSGVN